MSMYRTHLYQTDHKICALYVVLGVIASFVLCARNEAVSSLMLSYVMESAPHSICSHCFLQFQMTLIYHISSFRWCVTQIFYVRFFRGFLNINNVGLNPPPVLRLSDGGHFEN